MHEMSIVQSLLSIVEEEMSKNNAATLKAVRVTIGEMSGIVPDALKTCFEILTAKSEMKGAVLKMDITPLIGCCKKCQKEFKVEKYNFLCPECESTDVEIISGREMNIVELEVD